MKKYRYKFGYKYNINDFTINMENMNIFKKKYLCCCPLRFLKRQRLSAVSFPPCGPSKFACSVATEGSCHHGRAWPEGRRSALQTGSAMPQEHRMKQSCPLLPGPPGDGWHASAKKQSRVARYLVLRVESSWLRGEKGKFLRQLLVLYEFFMADQPAQ